MSSVSKNDEFAYPDILCIFAITQKFWVVMRFTPGILNFLPRCLFSHFSRIRVPCSLLSLIGTEIAEWRKEKCSFSDEDWHLTIDFGQNISKQF